MTKPQQNELRRSGKGATDQDSAELKAQAGREPAEKGRTGKVPLGNQPGWKSRGEGPAENYPDA
jgi:hypothetical protein